MRFVVDAQLPPALARLLSANGHKAEHAFDIGPQNASDKDLWDYAIAQGAAVITKDVDFRDMLATFSKGPAIVWVRVGNVSRNALLEWFEP